MSDLRSVSNGLVFRAFPRIDVFVVHHYDHHGRRGKACGDTLEFQSVSRYKERLYTGT